MKNPPHGKARDYAPGEEQYPDRRQRTIYREGYKAGLAGAEANHNPHGRPASAIWEAGRARGREEYDAGEESTATKGEGQ